MANKQYVVPTGSSPGSVGGGGTVTSVTGTANQIDVATGTTTPVLSVSSTLITPGTVTVSQAGALSQAAVSITGAPITGGTATTTFPLVYLNSGVAPTTWNTSGTALGINAPSGFGGNFVDLHVNGGTSVFRVAATGIVVSSNSYTAGATSQYNFSSSTRIVNNSDGVLALQNTAQTDFGRLQLGGTTSSFPAIKRNATGIDIRLADDSDYAPLGAKSVTITDTAANTDLSLTNTTAATSGTSQSSPITSIGGKYWTGAASAADTWTIQNVVGNGTNGTSRLTFTHAGSSGVANILVPPGSTAQPSLSFTTDVGTGIMSAATGLLGILGSVRNFGTFGEYLSTAGIIWSSDGAYSGFDLGIFRAAAKVIEISDGTTPNANGWINWGGQKRVSTQFDKTSDATLGNVTGLSVNVAAGRTYTFEAMLHVNQLAVGGSQFAIGGTATATAIIYAGVNTVASTGAIVTPTTGNRATALAGVICDSVTGATLYVTISGTITVNAAGTLTVQFAQKVSNGTASSVLVGSSFTVYDCP